MGCVDCVSTAHRCSWGTVAPSAIIHEKSISTNDALESVLSTIPPEQILEQLILAQIQSLRYRVRWLKVFEIPNDSPSLIVPQFSPDQGTDQPFIR